MSGQDPSLMNELNTRLETGTEYPKMYRVLLHNDHYTTMEFVVDVLMKVFHKTAAEAAKIMLDVHRGGQGTCGVYIRDIAVTKVSHVQRLAREEGFPLRCSCEET